VSTESHRILMVDQFGTMGGGQRVLLGMARRGVELGWSVSVAVPDGPLTPELEGVGATVLPLDMPRLADGSKGPGDVLSLARRTPGLVRQFNSAVSEARPDVIHVNGGRTLLPVALAKPRARDVFPVPGGPARTMMPCSGR